MKKNLKWVLIALASLLMVLIFVACTKAHAQNSSVERWEYRVVSFRSYELEGRVELLNELGNEDWELIFIEGSDTRTMGLYFKRRYP